MHRLSVLSLAALLIVGGVLAFAIFVSPHATAAQSAPQTPSQTVTSHTSSIGTNGTLLTQPPAPSGGTGSDDGSTFDS